MLLPVDTVAAKAFSNVAEFRVVEGSLNPDEMGLDIGPKTARLYASAVRDAENCSMNGPMGVFEMPNFAKGTIAVAEAMAEIEGTTIIVRWRFSAAVTPFGIWR